MAKGRFWYLTQPAIESDYRNIWLNGSVEHPFSLPGVTCSRCGQTWANMRHLPIELPKPLWEMSELRSHWPIPDSAHRDLCSRVERALLPFGVSVERLAPGDTFMPAYLDIPTIPTADFLWSCLGAPLVSERVRAAFMIAGVNGATFLPVQLRNVGLGDATTDPATPGSGEPEDLLNHKAGIADVSAIGPYFEMIVTETSDEPDGVIVLADCSACSRQNRDVQESQSSRASRNVARCRFPISDNNALDCSVRPCKERFGDNESNKCLHHACLGGSARPRQFADNASSDFG